MIQPWVRLGFQDETKWSRVIIIIRAFRYYSVLWGLGKDTFTWTELHKIPFDTMKYKRNSEKKKKVKKTWVYEYICKVWRLEASAASQTARFFFSPTLGTFYLVTALCLELSPPCSYIQPKIWSKKKNYANWKAASELSSVCALLAVQLM